MVLLLFATQACTDIFLPGLPAIAREFGVTMHGANMTIAAYNYSQAAVVLFIGVVSDAFGRRGTVLVCFALHIAAAIWIALSASLPWIVAMRVVQAAGSAAVYIVLRLAIKDTLDKQAQVHATGLLVMGLVLSPILAPVAGAWIIHWFGWRGCFWAIAALEAPLFAWTWRALRETNQRRDALRAAFSWRGYFRHYLTVLTDPFFLGMALIVGSAFAAFYALHQRPRVFSTWANMACRRAAMPPFSSPSRCRIWPAIAWMSRLNASAMPPRYFVRLGIAVSCAGAAAIVLSLWARPGAGGPSPRSRSAPVCCAWRRH